jgi:conserved protein with predicted RNA binding PUA domain
MTNYQRKVELSKSKLMMSLDFIFGEGTSKNLELANLEFQYSRRTGRLRYVYDKTTNELLFSFRPNGSIAPTVIGASALLGAKRPRSSTLFRLRRKRPRWVVTVIDGVSEIVARGKSVFCKHVANCNLQLLPGVDVAVANQRGEILAVGSSLISGQAMKQFKRGVAIKVREGALKNVAANVV